MREGHGKLLMQNTPLPGVKDLCIYENHLWLNLGVSADNACSPHVGRHGGENGPNRARGEKDDHGLDRVGQDACITLQSLVSGWALLDAVSSHAWESLTSNAVASSYAGCPQGGRV